MKVTCPSCSATFLVESEHLGATGRKVRCGACAHVWRQVPPSDQEAAAEAAEPFAPEAPGPDQEADAPEARAEPLEPEPKPAVRIPEESERTSRRSRPRGARPAPPRRNAGLVAGWTLFFVVVAGLGSGFVLGRNQLVATVPEMKRLYDLVGLPAEPQELGLDLRDVKLVRRLVDGERVVMVEGVVVNVSKWPRDVPPLRASLTDSKGIELDRWTFQAADATLQPGGTTTFESVAKDPPREGNLSIDFVLEE